MRSFPTLYARSSAGKTKEWSIRAEGGSPPQIITTYGYVDGEKQTTAIEVPSGKNTGRANQTTAYEQACLEAEAKWNKKRDAKYVEDPSGTSLILLPMLAQDYKKRSHNIEYPAFVQPKLNGIRMLARKVGPGEILFTSRRGKEFNALHHLVRRLDEVMDLGAILDGELYNHDLPLQDIASAVRREKSHHELTETIQYWVYDCIIDDATFEKRYKFLSHAIDPYGRVRRVETIGVENEAALKKHHAEFVAQGYEGTIVRNKKGLYRCDFRSSDLQKYKDHTEEEFIIAGGKEGVGLAKGTIIWTCMTEEGRPFDVKPMGTVEQRREWWENKEKFFGKQLTVRYQNRSKDNIPIFPRGVALRNYEE
ncbi:MAG: hypothetical protein L0Y56_06085 [Nitrospira sp.]|nr:hypothetical protein [Nitrospira sp.]